MSAVAAQISVYNGVVTCQEGTGGITTITLATHETINQVRRHVLSRFDPGSDNILDPATKKNTCVLALVCVAAFGPV